MDDRPAFLRDRRRLRRSAWYAGAAGAFFVFLAIPTNSRVIVAVGLILAALAHALLLP
jgi:hypothetical protein